ncbi:hypothetical protein V5799_016604 [Amblyomma americanum]|uniref:Galectin n=1 Tax=Amblyomma americanum TaxID=6943 RepID=A0AAQ4F4N4_AMBAM
MDHPLEKLVPGTVIDLAGKVIRNHNRFHINLETGTGEIALHVNPRFDEGEVVFNTLRNGRWEREERVGRLPVQQGCSFEAMILVEEMGYKVFHVLVLESMVVECTLYSFNSIAFVSSRWY